jgi:threonine/homoserine/homoserine lactone efflux protein
MLGVTVNMIAIVGNVILVVVASSVTGILRRKAAFAVLMNKAMGVIFIALGLRLTVEKAP